MGCGRCSSVKIISDDSLQEALKCVKPEVFDGLSLKLPETISELVGILKAGFGECSKCMLCVCGNAECNICNFYKNGCEVLNW